MSQNSSLEAAGQPVSKAPEALRRASETVWLVERGPSENHEPTVWWSGNREIGWSGWTTDPHLAMRFPSREEAHAEVLRLSAHISQPTSRAVEHVFVGTTDA